MKIVSSPNSIETDFDPLIETLKNASLTRDYAVLKQYLAPYLEEDLSPYSLIDQAYLNYFLGYFLVHSGKTQNLKNQEQGRDFLTRAVDQFRQSAMDDEAIEAQISLGWSYYQTGEVTNYESFLLDALSQCDSKSDAYVSVNVSLLIVYYKEQNYVEALNIIESLQQQVSVCQNLRIKCQYFNNAGLIYRDTGDIPKAVDSFGQSINNSKILGNKQFEAQSLNCLANLYLQIRCYDLALQHAETALDIFKLQNQTGFIASVLDTKANILSAKGEFIEAYTIINAALTYFRRSESYLEWTECLWNKIEILYQLNKKLEIIETFSELSAVSMLNLSLEKQKLYQKKFADLIIIPFGETLDGKLEICKRSIIEPILAEVGEVVKTARRLGLKHHQNLTNYLEKNSDLKKYLVKQNKARADKSEITLIQIKKFNQNANLLDSKSFGYFRCSQRLAKRFFNQDNELVLKISQNYPIRNGDLYLLSNDFPFIVEITFEDGQVYFVDEDGNTLSKTVRVIGKIIGYAPASELGQERIEFSKVSMERF